MKRILAILVLCSLLTLCACQGTYETGVEEEGPASQKEEVTDKPSAGDPSLTPDGKQQSGRVWNYQVEDLLLEDYAEEIVSCTLHIPSVTLDSENGTAILAEAFGDLPARLQNYAHTTVYEKAQELQAIAVMTGDYSVSLEGDILTILYTVQVEYRLTDPEAGEDPVSEFTNTYTFDLVQETLSSEK